MGELRIKLESLRDSKEREKLVQGLRDSVKDQNERLLNLSVESSDYSEEITEWDMIRHELNYIKELKEVVAKVKDKECREALLADLDKSILWRENRILGKTNEYKLDTYEIWDKNYTTEDLRRSENWWIECISDLPIKLINIEKEKEKSAQAVEQAEIQEQIDALSTLEDVEWLN